MLLFIESLALAIWRWIILAKRLLMFRKSRTLDVFSKIPFAYSWQENFGSSLKLFSNSKMSQMWWKFRNILALDFLAYFAGSNSQIPQRKTQFPKNWIIFQEFPRFPTSHLRCIQNIHFPKWHKVKERQIE